MLGSVSSRGLREVAEEGPGKEEKDDEEDEGGGVEEGVDAEPKRRGAKIAPGCQTEVGEEDDEDGVVVPGLAEVAVKEGVEGTLCATSRTLPSGEEPEEAFGHKPAR